MLRIFTSTESSSSDLFVYLTPDPLMLGLPRARVRCSLSEALEQVTLGLKSNLGLFVSSGTFLQFSEKRYSLCSLIHSYQSNCL